MLDVQWTVMLAETWTSGLWLEPKAAAQRGPSALSLAKAETSLHVCVNPMIDAQ